MSLRIGTLLAAVAALPALAYPAAGRSLHWSSLDVEARVDAQGALRISEEHTLVFTGAWNGGERIFRLEPGQRLDLERIARIDPATGKRRELVRGNLDAVDHYDWIDGETLRWRSRLPSDAPFVDETLTYVLDYRLTGVLEPVGQGVYRLDHDFAFPDRSGSIDRFRLRLSVDPAFRPLAPLATDLELSDLAPGESVVRTARLRYLGEGRPAALRGPRRRPTLPTLAFAGAVVGMAWLLVGFYRRERALGRRWWRLPRSPEIDRSWIEERLRSMPAEVAGAVWDWKIGSQEVAALLARWVAEGKVETEMVPREARWLGPKTEMSLHLKVDRERFSGYERDLIEKLFYGGRPEVKPSDLRRAYRRTGFDPAQVIRSDLERELKRKVPGVRTWTEPPSARPLGLLVAALLALLLLEALARPGSALSIGFALVLLTLLPYLFGRAAALAARLRLDWLAAWTAALAVPVAVTFLGALLYALAPEAWPGLATSPPPGPFGVLALALAPVLVWSALLRAAMSRADAAAIAARQELLQVRRYFAAELRKPGPSLDDAWYPYLLALGLASAVDRWAKSFGSVSRPRTEPMSADGLVSGTGSAGAVRGTPSPGGSTDWSGGGGRFGGAGASTAWVAAVGSFAWGMSTGGPGGGGFVGTTGGDGLGGGGGSFSGGGGGGGW